MLHLNLPRNTAYNPMIYIPFFIVILIDKRDDKKEQLTEGTGTSTETIQVQVQVPNTKYKRQVQIQVQEIGTRYKYQIQVQILIQVR